MLSLPKNTRNMVGLLFETCFDSCTVNDSWSRFYFSQQSGQSPKWQMYLPSAAKGLTIVKAFIGWTLVNLSWQIFFRPYSTVGSTPTRCRLFRPLRIPPVLRYSSPSQKDLRKTPIVISDTSRRPKASSSPISRVPAHPCSQMSTRCFQDHRYFLFK